MNTLRSREKLDSWLSRESAFLAQNILFLAVAFITLWGTIYPVFSRAAQDVTITVGRPFFDRVNGPILLALVFLMGVGPLLPWRKASARNVLLALRVPLIGAAIVGVALAVAGVRQPVAVVAVAVCAIAIIGVVHEWVRGTRSRHRKGESYHTAFWRLLMANRPRYGGYIVHLAITMLAIGAIGSSFFDVQRDFNLKQGETASLGGYSFRYIDTATERFPDREEVTGRFEVIRGDRSLGMMESTRSFYSGFNVSAMRAAIRSTPVEDFYIIPSEFEADGGVVIRVLVTPLVWWMWASGPLFILGTLLALSPRRQPAYATARLPRGAGLAKA